MMQMLHSTYDLQECMEFGEFKLAMQEAALWVQQKRNGNLPNDPRIKDF
jgi:soluble cytochrome b562